MTKDIKKQTLSERLLRYSAVASLAASGALIAGAPQALADGTSRDVNCVMNAAGEFCDIDFDNDGNPEFRLFLSSSYTSDLWMQFRSGGGDAGLSFVSSQAPFYAAALPFGSSLSAARGDWTNATTSWSNTGVILYTSTGYGNWAAPKGNATDSTQGAYVGVRFDLDGNGNTHYGWIELYIPSNGNVTVKRIGYDTTVGASIPTAVQMRGLRSASGLRAVGAAASAALAGVFTWLRRKTMRA